MFFFKLYYFFLLLFLSKIFAAETLLSTLCPNDNLVFSNNQIIHQVIKLTSSKMLIAVACQTSGIYFEIRDETKQILKQKLITDISPNNGNFKVEPFKDGGFVIAAFDTATNLLLFQTYDASGQYVQTISRVFPHTQTETTNGVWTMIVSTRTAAEYIVFAGHMTGVNGDSFSYIIYNKDGSVAKPIVNSNLKKLAAIHMAELPSNRFVIGYVRERDDISNTEFYYRIIKFDGTIIQGEDRGTPASLYTNADRMYGIPIYYEESSEFAIVYGRNENDIASNNDIFYIRYDLSGNYISRTQLNTVQKTRYLKSVRTLYPGSHQWIVSWETVGQDGDSFGIYYVIMTGGSKDVAETRANSITTGDQFLLDIVPLTLKAFAMVFTCHNSAKTLFNTVITTYNTNGDIIKTENSLNTATNNIARTYPKIEFFENTNEVLVLWKGGTTISTCRMYFNTASIYCLSADSICILGVPKINPTQILLRSPLTTSITNKMISGEEGDKTIYTFSVSQTTNGQFGLTSSPSNAISTFTMNDITSNKIIFVRTTNSPLLKLKVADSLQTSNDFDITFLSITPTMDLAAFIIFQGNSIILTETEINGTYYKDYEATYIISNALNGFFENIDNLGTQITSFTSTDLKANKIKYTHDNVIIIPNFDIIVSDGIETSSVLSSTITLKNLVISFKGFLTIRSGSTVDLTSDYLTFDGPASFNFLSTTLTSLIIQKKTAAGTAITSFSKTDFSQSQIQIVHDGSDNLPVFCLKISDSINESPIACSLFKFILKPKFLINKVRVVQGQILLIDESMIMGRVDQTLTILYRVKSVANCFFALSKNKNAAVSSFNKDQLISNQVFLVHDGSLTACTYDIEVYDGELTATLAPTINFFKLPVMTTNALTLIEGETVTLNSGVDVLGTTYYNYKLTYYVTNVLNGYFDLSSNPSSIILNFSDDDLNQKKVRFVHNTDSEPFYEISVKDDVGLSKTLPVSMKYTAKIKITKNAFTLARNEKVVISTDNIDVVSLSDDSSVVIFIEENTFCWFENINNPSVEIKSFTKKVLKANSIKLFHDGSINRPSFKIKASDGTQITKSIEAILAFDGVRSIIVDKNYMFLNQGAKVILTNYMLNVVNGFPNTDFIFQISKIKFCSIYNSNDKNTPITEFKQSDINSQQILIIHDDSENAPSISLTIYEAGAVDGFQLTINGNIGFNRKPKLTKNQIILNKGEKRVIDSNFIQAYDFETQSANLMFKVINQKSCRFERKSEPGLMIETFYGYELEQKLIQIVHDKTENPPYYMVAVTDGTQQSEFMEPDVKFFISKGLAGLLKANELLTNLMYDVKFYKNEEYIIGILYQGIMLIINIYDPSKPNLIKSIDLKTEFGFSKLTNLKIVNDIAFVTSQEKTLGIIDLSNFDNPSFKTSLDEANKPVCDMVTIENYIYIALCGDGLKIVFLDSDWKLVEKFIYKKDSESFKAVSVIQNTIGLLCESGKVILLDFSDKTKDPILSKTIETLIGTGSDLKLSADIKLAYVLTSSNIYILDLLSSSIKYQKSFKGGTKIQLSSDSTYLLVNFNKGVSFFNIQNSNQPVLLDSISYGIYITNMIMKSLGDYVYLSSSNGLQTIKVLKVDKARISPYLKELNPNNLNSNCMSILTLKSNDVSYLSCQEKGLIIYDITNSKESSTITGTFTSIVFRNNEKEIYAIKDGQISIYTVLSKLLPAEVQTISIENSDLSFLKFSPSKNYFAAISKTSKYFIIYDVDGSKALSNKISLKSACTPNYVSFNYLETIFYINCEKTEILVYDVTKKRSQFI